jgi:hypothetical protein
MTTEELNVEIEKLDKEIELLKALHDCRFIITLFENNRIENPFVFGYYVKKQFSDEKYHILISYNKAKVISRIIKNQIENKNA